MMKNRNKFIIVGLINICVLLATSLSLTVSWFVFSYGKYSGNISGSILESYFDKKTGTTSGDPGTEGNPYVISRPKHYENLVKLYTKSFYDPDTGNSINFSDQNFYFEIGKEMVAGSGEYLVYDYNEYGVYQETQSTTLNLSYLDDLEPIGNDLHPFNATINGHGITISNFTVCPNANAGQSYNDVGIFGFVGEQARVSNCYWNTFSIDPTGATQMNHDVQICTQHNDNIRVGYLAGHVITHESFTNCYVNKCTIDSPSISATQRNEYGYYGMIERDKLGSALPGGKNYNFKFDSESVHNYLNTNLSAIENEQLTLRKTPEGEIQPTNATLGDGLYESTLNSYYIQGQTVDNQNTYSGRTYSLSTIGYVGGQTTLQQKTYPTKWQNDGTYYDLDPSTTYSPYGLNDNIEPSQQGKFHYTYDTTNGKWVYYYCDNYAAKSTDTFSFTLKFNSYEEVCWGGKVSQFTMYLYYDNVTTPITWNGSSSFANRRITWSCADKVITLPVGTHNWCLYTYQKYSGTFGSWNIYNALAGSISGTSTEQNPTISMTSLVSSLDQIYNKTTANADGSYTNSLYIADKTLSLNFSDYNDGHRPTVSHTSASPGISDGYILHGEAHVQTDMYYVSEGDTKLQLKSDENNDFSNASFAWSGTTLMVTANIVTLDETTIERHYIADEDDIAKDGYNPDCIDIVGGGVGFYYYNIGNSTIKICRVQSEGKTAANTVVKKITSSDCNGSTKFYATERCRQSIVLYIKNYGSATDSIDDDLGEMDFVYYQLNMLTQSTVHPSYKKGATSSSVDYIDFEDVYGEAEPYHDSTNRLIHENAKFTESLCKKACYCCLDEDGNILGNYKTTTDDDGNEQIVYDVGMTAEKEALIDTYVMVIGCFTNANFARWNLWVELIDFSYKSFDGQGGSFGSVGYRNSPDTIDATILNYIIEKANPGTVYSVTVNFVKDDATYYVDINVTSGTLTIKFYNYYSSTYKIMVTNNGVTETIRVGVATRTYSPPS